MFEHFTIGAPAHRASSTFYNISPCDTRSPSPPSRLSSSDVRQKAQSTVTELASQLDDLKAQKDDISSSYFCNSSNSLDATMNDAFLPLSLTVDPMYENDTKSVPNPPPSISTLRACRRLQRQLNTQLLCTHAQVKAISELVEEMVSTKSQCNVTTPPAISQPPSSPSPISIPNDLEADDNILPDPVDDEGYCEGSVEEDEDIETETLLMNLRQASAPLGIRRRACVQGAVFAKPRMRRMILRRKRVETRVETGM